MHKRPITLTATMAALDLPASGEVPDWIHLLPAPQGELRTYDGRGPYRLTDAQAVIAASLAADPRDGGGLLIDENHALELSASKGGPSPSRGRIVEMQARADGIWGRVDWNDSGRALLAERAYRGISPVIIHDAQGVILRIKNAALVNYPNLRGQTALNQEEPMSFMARLAQRLGKPAEASEDDLIAAIPENLTALQSQSTDFTALQSQLAEIATALGVPGGAAPAVLAAAKTRAAVAPAELAALQAELTKVSTSFAALQTETKREKATAFIDRAIAEARPGVKPLRDHYIARHMQDATAVEKEILMLPSHGPDKRPVTPTAPQAQGNDLTALNAEAQGRALAARAKTWQAEQAAKGLAVTFTDAVRHVEQEVLL